LVLAMGGLLSVPFGPASLGFLVLIRYKTVETGLQSKCHLWFAAGDPVAYFANLLSKVAKWTRRRAEP